MDLLTVPDSSPGAVDPKQECRELALTNLFQRFQHPPAGAPSDRTLHHDASHPPS